MRSILFKLKQKHVLGNRMDACIERDVDVSIFGNYRYVAVRSLRCQVVIVFAGSRFNESLQRRKTFLTLERLQTIYLPDLIKGHGLIGSQLDES